MGIDEKLIEEIVRRVVEVAAPDRIILYGSAATGQMTPESDIDLLLLKPAPQSRWEESERIRKALGGLGYRFDVFVVATKRFEETKDLIGGMAYAPHKYGRVIYTRRGAEQPRGRPGPARPREEVIRELRDHWIEVAERNLGVARYTLSENLPSPDLAATNARYAAEQYLKAFLTHHQVEFTKVTDLGALMDRVASVDHELAHAVRAALALNPYDLDWSPLDGPELSRDDIERLAALAAKVRDAVRSALGLPPPSDDPRASDKR